MNDLSKKNIARQLRSNYGNWKRSMATRGVPSVAFIKNFTNPRRLVRKQPWGEEGYHSLYHIGITYSYLDKDGHNHRCLCAFLFSVILNLFCMCFHERGTVFKVKVSSILPPPRC